MSSHPIVHEGKRWRTAEALFQALRFEDALIRERIGAARSPMMARIIAKRHKQQRVVEPMWKSETDTHCFMGRDADSLFADEE